MIGKEKKILITPKGIRFYSNRNSVFTLIFWQKNKNHSTTIEENNNNNIVEG